MAFQFKNELRGKRLILRRTKPTLAMAETMFKAVDANRSHLEPWFHWPALTQKMEDSLKYLFDKEERTAQGKIVEYGLFFEKEYLGNISIFNIDNKNKSAEIGYWLSATQTRQGYMTEAVRILEKEVFENLGLNRIRICCDQANEASATVAKKCGYCLEGIFREDNFNNYFDGFRNTLVFSKLKSEYSVQG